MIRSEADIRVELARWIPVAMVRRSKGEMESLAAAMIVQTLTWVLGESESPAIRGKYHKDK